MSVDPAERDLLTGLGKKDTTATETIYRRHYSMVQSMVLAGNGSIDDARDVFQETMLVLYDKVRNPGFELTCLLKTYIYSVARRLWLKRRQLSQKTVPALEDIEETVSVEEDVDATENAESAFLIMDKAMAGLGEPCRSLLTAFYLEKRSMSEIAGNFGYTNAENAKNQKYKCLTRLKKLFFARYKSQ
ncbi:MAG: sigma-70 family RNA polymerase sigma factor [Bacteroidetes bacterium]|nr:sigma-70 family RNA polymerase sigma factor [Bacteroidota bacterium]